MRYDPIPVEDVRPHLAHLLRALAKSGHAATIEENKSEPGQVILTLDGKAAPFRTVKSFTVMMLDLICPMFGRRTIALKKSGSANVDAAVDAVDFFIGMKREHERLEDGRVALRALECAYGIEHGKRTPTAVSFSDVRLDNSDIGERRAEVYLSTHVAISLDTAEKVLNLLAAEGVIRRAK